MKNNIITRLEELERKKPEEIKVVIVNGTKKQEITTVRDFINNYLPLGWEWVRIESGNRPGDISALLDATIIQSFENLEDGTKALKRVNAVFG